ncbi:MAG: Holliday junction branch migration protein RuvA [Bacteroidales bacterium]|nr:Holliday junction branch migration protein RuvA [Bacteroidales bacterium]
MYDYISGKIAELTPTRVVIDNNGIGYGAEISLQTYSQLESRTEATVYVLSQVNQREGTSIYYGFFSKDERELFRLMTAVSGIGAATARMVLSTLSADEFREAILTEDVRIIKSVKGIGLKGAQRLVLELKDKIVKGEGYAETLPIHSAADSGAAAEEAASALQMLGFSKPNISKALQSILKNNPSASVEEIIKSALQIL